jgi:hypothetical protein
MNLCRYLVLLSVLALAGCSCTTRQPGVTGSAVIPITEPGPFPHSALMPTIGPADGAATLLILAEKPITVNPQREEVPGDHATLGFHGFPESHSGQTITVAGGELGTGWGSVRRAGKENELHSAIVTFKTVKTGQPSEGTYDLTLKDGTRIRGMFRAQWHKGRWHE